MDNRDSQQQSIVNEFWQAVKKRKQNNRIKSDWIVIVLYNSYFSGSYYIYLAVLLSCKLILRHGNLSSGDGIFPWYWKIFPFILPRSVREKVYEPALEELKEDYLRATPLWRGWLSKRWLTFCFTVRTFSLVQQSLWAAIGSKGRKVAFALLAGTAGAQNAETIRTKLAQWFGLM